MELPGCWLYYYGQWELMGSYLLLLPNYHKAGNCLGIIIKLGLFHCEHILTFIMKKTRELGNTMHQFSAPRERKRLHSGYD